MNNSNKKILVAEDEDSLRSMLVLVLQDEDYHVDDAINGKVALELLQNKQYDLLVTDLYMPKMNGIELIHACQNFYPSTKVLLMSGGGKDLEAEDGAQHITFSNQELTVDKFLKKPCNLNDFLSVIEDLLDKAEPPI